MEGGREEGTEKGGKNRNPHFSSNFLFLPLYPTFPSPFKVLPLAMKRDTDREEGKKGEMERKGRENSRNPHFSSNFLSLPLYPTFSSPFKVLSLALKGDANREEGKKGEMKRKGKENTENPNFSSNLMSLPPLPYLPSTLRRPPLTPGGKGRGKDGKRGEKMGGQREFSVFPQSLPSSLYPFLTPLEGGMGEGRRKGRKE